MLIYQLSREDAELEEELEDDASEPSCLLKYRLIGMLAALCTGAWDTVLIWVTSLLLRSFVELQY